MQSALSVTLHYLLLECLLSNCNCCRSLMTPWQQGLDRGNGLVTPQSTWRWCVCHVHHVLNLCRWHVLVHTRLAQHQYRAVRSKQLLLAGQWILRSVFTQNWCATSCRPGQLHLNYTVSQKSRQRRSKILLRNWMAVIMIVVIVIVIIIKWQNLTGYESNVDSFWLIRSENVCL